MCRPCLLEPFFCRPPAGLQHRCSYCCFSPFTDSFLITDGFLGSNFQYMTIFSIFAAYPFVLPPLTDERSISHSNRSYSFCTCPKLLSGGHCDSTFGYCARRLIEGRPQRNPQQTTQTPKQTRPQNSQPPKARPLESYDVSTALQGYPKRVYLNSTLYMAIISTNRLQSLVLNVMNVPKWPPKRKVRGNTNNSGI